MESNGKNSADHKRKTATDAICLMKICHLCTLYMPCLVSKHGIFYKIGKEENHVL